MSDTKILEKNALPDQKKRVVALGNFDGLHLGHIDIITTALSLAKEKNLSLCIYTFSENTSKEKLNSIITTNNEKIEILSSLGVDEILFDDFLSVKELLCYDFCKTTLVDILNCEIAVCGENFLFGKNRSANSFDLVNTMKKLSKSAVISPLKKENEKIVSSSVIRSLLSKGEVDKALCLMNRPFSITSQVIPGRQLARKMGFSTANQIPPQNKVKLKNGVYISICHINGKKYPSITNIGTKPTISSDEKDTPILCESHILGFDGDLYSYNLRVDFYKLLRNEIKFDSISELKTAIKSDVEVAKDFFESRKELLI